MSASTPPVQAALAAVMDDVKAVAKRDRNEHQRFMFRGIDAVVNAVAPLLRKHRVVVVPVVRDVAYDRVTTTNDKPATACRVLVDYVFHGPAGDQLTTTVIGEAWDHGDKAAPKAMSVAFRTALLQALALPTDESDPDAATYEQQAVEHISPAQMKALQAAMGSAGITERDDRLAFVADTIDRPISTANDLTRKEASRVLDRLKQAQTPPDPHDGRDPWVNGEPS